MKVGLTLPQFRHEAEPALETAGQAEAVGLDGVFVFDHLWPLGQPTRPALHGHTLAGALLAGTGRIAVGTLVARVGLLPNAVLANQFATLFRIGGSRLVAGVGVGDRLSRPENLAVGVPFRPVDERLASLVDVCRRLRAGGVTTWVGGNSPTMRAIARHEADAVNLWGVDPAAVGEAGAAGGAVTWAGQVQVGALGVDGVAALLGELARRGAAWAVVAPVGTPWPEAVETVGAAAGALVD